MIRIVTICILTAIGCSQRHWVDFSVTSTPDSARVDVGGAEMGTTPFHLTLLCGREWVGLFNGDGGYANSTFEYEVKAFPPTGSGGTTQTKRINPCLTRNQDTTKVHFDLMLQPVAPTQNVNLNLGQVDSAEEQKLKRIRLLKRMLDEGLLSDDDYRKRVDKILSE